MYGETWDGAIFRPHREDSWFDVRAIVEPLSLRTSFATVGVTAGKAGGQLGSPVCMDLDNKKCFSLFAQLNVGHAIMEIPQIGAIHFMC
jgi:hypothetical protein